MHAARYRVILLSLYIAGFILKDIFLGTYNNVWGEFNIAGRKEVFYDIISMLNKFLCALEVLRFHFFLDPDPETELPKG